MVLIVKSYQQSIGVTLVYLSLIIVWLCDGVSLFERDGDNKVQFII